MSPPVRPHPSGVAVTVWVVPSASSEGVVGKHGDAVKVRVRQPADRGRANRAVVTLLETILGTSVSVVAGTHSRRKTLVVEGGTVAHVERVLGL